MHPRNGNRFPARLVKSSNLFELWLAFTVTIWAGIGLADDSAAQGVDAGVQEKVAQLIQSVLGPFRSIGDFNSGATNNSFQILTNIEASFREASALMPTRLDLRFGVASALLLQATLTNSQFDLKIKDALRVYQEIRALDPNGFEAPMLYAAYTRAIGETNASDATIDQLMAVHPHRTHEYLERFRRLDKILQSLPNVEPQTCMPTNECHAIVVLGAALETNGAIKAKLIGRLQQGSKLARIYPEAPIIVTGGNQKGGITEAYAMSLWLQKEGVRSDRLYLEDKARDTLGNAVFSCAILQKLGVTHVTVVTSANHIRRGLAVLEEACLQQGLRLNFTSLAAIGEPDLDRGRDRVAVYRDVMRASGLWAFPGIQP
jgi:DUF218 domain